MRRNCAPAPPDDDGEEAVRFDFCLVVFALDEGGIFEAGHPEEVGDQRGLLPMKRGKAGATVGRVCEGHRC